MRTKRILWIACVVVLAGTGAYLAPCDKEEYLDVGASQAPFEGPMTLHGALVASESVASVAPDLRREKALRSLTAFEALRSSNRLPSGTYFFLPRSVFDREKGTLYDTLYQGVPMEKEGEGELFEVHKYSPDRYALLGFASGDSYFSSRDLDGAGERSLVLSPRYSEAFDHLVQVPVYRISTSEHKDGRLHIVIK